MKNTPTNSLSSIKPQPTVSIDTTLLPEIKHWRIGHKYTIMLEVEQMEIGRNEFEDNAPIRGRFKILTAKSIDKPNQNDMKDKIKEKAERY